MSYPVLPQSYQSKEVRLSGRQLDRATNGTVKIRSFYTAQKKEFTIVHPALTPTQKASVEAFYAANALNSFSFTWAADSTAYTCVFTDQEPTYTPVDGLRWDVTVSMAQV